MLSPLLCRGLDPLRAPGAGFAVTITIPARSNSNAPQPFPGGTDRNSFSFSVSAKLSDETHPRHRRLRCRRAGYGCAADHPADVDANGPAADRRQPDRKSGVEGKRVE